MRRKKGGKGEVGKPKQFNLSCPCPFPSLLVHSPSPSLKAIAPQIRPETKPQIQKLLAYLISFFSSIQIQCWSWRLNLYRSMYRKMYV